VNAALLLGQRHAGRAPAIGAQAGSVVDGQAQIIAQLGTLPPFGLVLVTQRGPVPGQISLAEGGKADQRRCEEMKDTHRKRAMGAGAITGPARV